jgi:8-oxo-dGTP diphosphatase
MKKQIKVVAAIIENNNNEILCALRSPSMDLPNHWEFPGGKIEVGESHKDAIEREILEELACEVKFNNIFNENVYEYDAFIVDLTSVKCTLISGTPTASEHSKLVWLKRENLNSLIWAPADLAAVEQLIEEKV